jgi:hypothetical protein
VVADPYQVTEDRLLQPVTDRPFSSLASPSNGIGVESPADGQSPPNVPDHPVARPEERAGPR